MQFFTKSCTLLALIGAFSAIGQSQYQISGAIENENEEAVPFANVVFLQATDSSFVSGVVAAVDGRFQAQLAQGYYLIHVSYIGYRKTYTAPFLLQTDTLLSAIRLQPNTQQMQEVVVEAKKVNVEVKPGMTTYNLSNTTGLEASSAMDLMQNIPSTAVGMDDEVTYRGRKVAILIDGVATDVENILEQIPASQIASIEVISNPSAKYDARNGESVINIILKKNSTIGINGNIAATLGGDHYKKLAAGANFSQNKLKIGMYGNMRWDERLDRQTSLRTAYYDNPIHTRQLYTGNINEIAHNYRLSLSQKFDGGALVQGSMALGFADYRNDREYAISRTRADTDERVTLRDRQGQDSRAWNRSSLVFRKPIGENALKITAKAGYSSRKYAFAFVDSLFVGEQGFQRIARTDSIQDDLIPDWQLELLGDYEHTLPGSFQLDYGAFAKRRITSRHYQYYRLKDSWELDSIRSNRYHYLDEEYGGYVLLNGQHPAHETFTFTVGGRLTYTSIRPEADGVDSLTTNNYWSLQPSLQLSYRLSETSGVALSYTHKNKAPNYRFLNPFRTIYSPSFMSYGNPLLEPEVIQTVELEYDKSWKDNKVFASNSIYYRNVSNATVRHRFEDDQEVINNTFANVPSMGAVGLESITQLKLVKKLKVQNSLNVYNAGYTTYNADQEEIRRRATSLTSKTSVEYTLPKGTSAKVQFNCFSDVLTAQGSMEGYYFADVYLRHQLFDKSVNLNLRMADVFHTWKRSVDVDQSETFVSESIYTRNTSRYYLTIAYKFVKSS
ncbi:outer membrane beta-barrel protein [Marinoscillum furvescens]|uniref:TonB-dependent receptor-like protein n=1 Tax=Marinoscillum furvescens DSM 4134 TaxID=1122208 RepID=A0A3D9L355_MARFU|nr:outer membrane beta-barrel protein [Marinoscillum furvescens]RED98424.1 TonB-dependent receptor-like protein [Marinoscillum furvescens DSM 4134]